MGTWYRRWRGRIGGRTGEIALLAIVALVTGVGGYLVARPFELTEMLRGGWALLGAAVAALAWRRRYPLVVLGITLLAAATYYTLGFPAGPEPLPFVVALYSVASMGRRGITISVAAGALLVVELTEVVKSSTLETSDMLPVVAWLIVVIVLGEFSRSRRDYLLEVEERALAAERTREAEACRRVAEERLRIARELHDSLGHHLTVVIMHAGGALLHSGTDPEPAYAALATIKSAGQEALRELRGTLQVLREFDADPAEARLRPRPTLEQLDDLVRRTEAAGPAVTTQVLGERRSLPANVELTAFRIVQEALTNVSRHAAADTVRVSLRYERDHLVVQIDDDGHGPTTPDGGGTGLIGMRQRAAAIGGQLVAGPRDGGGFHVYARLPAAGPE
jgi:signal transduction histidine kinase